MKRNLIICTLLIALGMTATMPACIFSTREDEVNSPREGGNTIPLNDPLQVFVAIKESLQSKQDANYERAISAQFIFSPTLQDSLDLNFDGTGVYVGWTKNREMSVLALLLADARTLRAEFAPQAEIQKNTFVRYRTRYELDVITAPADTARYRGTAFLDVRNESGNWRLTFWDEIETVEGFPTWGFLRGILGLRASP